LYSEGIEQIAAVLRTWARLSKQKFNVYNRVGYSETGEYIEVNLLREDHKVLRISSRSIELDYPRLKFVSTRNQLPILFDYDVLKSLDLKQLTEKELLNLFGQVFNIQTREQLALLLAWMLKTFYPLGEYPLLCVIGEREGVGKTTTCKFIVQLLDPSIAPLKTFPQTLDSLYTLAKNNFVLCFDNLSYINDDQSDALCQLSTGGSLSKRKLYTDAEVIDLPLKTPIILNSIFNILQRRDLRRRSVVLELKTPVERKPLREIEETFKRVAPILYSYLVLCVQEALKFKIIDLDFLDVADFCEWIAKAHPVFFMTPQEFVQTLKENREEIARELLESSLLLPIIQEKLKADVFGFWQTTAKELLEELKKKYPNEKNLPSTPDRLSRELKKLISDLEAVNIRTEFVRTPKKRVIVFSYIQQPKNEEETEESPNW
jgi:hypothetical protein